MMRIDRSGASVIGMIEARLPSYGFACMTSLLSFIARNFMKGSVSA